MARSLAVLRERQRQSRLPASGYVPRLMIPVLIMLLAVAVGAQEIPEEPPPGWRMFYVIAQTDGKTIEGTSYYSFTAFDILRLDENSVTIITEGGGTATLFPKDHPDMRFSSVPWDEATNSPRCPSCGSSKGYYSFVTGMLARTWFFLGLLVILTAFFALGLVGDNESLLFAMTFVGILLIIVLFIGSRVGKGYERYMDVYNETARSLQPYRFDEAYLLPVSYGLLDPEKEAIRARGLSHVFLTLLWMPLFLLVHVLALIRMPAAVRGGHLLFVPHPAEKHLQSVLGGRLLDVRIVARSVGHGNRENPPPKWVSDNQKRRLDALRKRFQAETGLLNSVIDFKRKRAELEDP